MRYLRRRGSAGLHGGAHRGRREGLRSRSENHTQSVSGDDETRISAWCASCAFFCGWSRASPVARPVGAVQSGGSSCQGSLLSLTEVEQSSATAESILQGDDLGR